MTIYLSPFACGVIVGALGVIAVLTALAFVASAARVRKTGKPEH